MNVASLDLCRELYELSGWKDISYVYWSNGARGLVDSQRLVFEKLDNTPAYDLGYLLRKLQENDNNCLVGWIAGNWESSFYNDKHHKREVADTPEDAAASLAVSLFKQNILTKEGAAL